MIDVVEPDEEFNAGLYKRLAEGLIERLAAESRRLILVGGTFLYVKLLLYGLIEGIPGDRELRLRLRREREEIGSVGMYEKLKAIDPRSCEAIHPNDYVRVERALEVYYLTGEPMSQLKQRHGYSGEKYDALKIALYDNLDYTVKRIDARVERMVERGLVEEVRGILAMGYSPELKPLKSIGYREIIDYLHGRLSLDRAVELIKRDTRRLAKRQMTWLRGERDVIWFHPERDYSKLLKKAEEFWRRGS